jgi:hypothetical protein
MGQWSREEIDRFLTVVYEYTKRCKARGTVSTTH